VPLREKAAAVRVTATLPIEDAEFRESWKLKSLLSPQTMRCGLSDPSAPGVWVGVEVGPGVGESVTLGLAVGLGEPLGVGLDVGDGVGEGEAVAEAVALWVAVAVALKLGVADWVAVTTTTLKSPKPADTG
jgi:hypothetical protein